MRFGKTVVLGEADSIAPLLVPLLRRDLARQGPRFVVQVGDKAIDYNEGFRLYMTTRNPSPDVPPDVASLVTVVNFSVTMSGLEGQLLGLTIQHEKPELEKQKSTLLAAEEVAQEGIGHYSCIVWCITSRIAWCIAWCIARCMA